MTGCKIAGFTDENLARLLSFQVKYFIIYELDSELWLKQCIIYDIDYLIKFYENSNESLIEFLRNLWFEIYDNWD